MKSSQVFGLVLSLVFRDLKFFPPPSYLALVWFQTLIANHISDFNVRVCQYSDVKKIGTCYCMHPRLTVSA